MARERLIISTAELQAVMGAINTDFEFDAIQSFVDDAETNHIIPAIGYGLYDALRGDDLDAKPARALKLLQKAVANFAIHYYVAFGSVQISEQGIMVKKDNNSLPASDKKVYQLRTQSRADGYRALEAAISYLEGNQADFSSYVNDEAHKRNRSLYVNTTADFSAGFDLRDNAETFYRLRGVIKTVEENYIDNILGDTLSTALRQAILDNSTNTAQKKLIAKIVKASALLTIAEAIPYNMVSFDASGMVTATIQSNTDNIEATSTGDSRRLQNVMNVTREKGLSELGKLIKFLKVNAADYTGYQVPEESTGINDQNRGFYYL